MNEIYWAASEDVSTELIVGTVVLCCLSFLLLLSEWRTLKSGRNRILWSGIAATLAVSVAVLRPARIDSVQDEVGPRVVVLVDQSRRLLLPTDQATRYTRSSQVVEGLRKRYPHARLQVHGFSEGPVSNWSDSTEPSGAEASDIEEAFGHLSAQGGEAPKALIVVSDGRFRGRALGSAEPNRQSIHAPIHTVSVATTAPNDASIRSVRAAGAAVAHQPLALTIEVGCNGTVECRKLAVSVRELKADVAVTTLAQGVADLENGKGTLELEVTLDMAGRRVVEIVLETPEGDKVPENNRRFITFTVARDRVRLLHLAGRPTYDVRALRSWLKRDEAVDVVAFFILRDSEGDDHRASPQEMALIEFPVDELFTKHLNSFDAIVLQDIDAIRYKLDRYLEGLAQYVRDGHGLIMVGGPSSFAGGNYSGTPLDSVLPVGASESSEPFDSMPFVPQYTRAGRVARVTQRLRELLRGSLPTMMGSNFLGAARPGSIVLWEHPLHLAADQPMPVLALGEAGDGRSIALGVDSTHKLAFGDLASQAAGRAYGALWDGLLGWLMRDPRYEAARVDVVGNCIDGRNTQLRLSRLPGMEGSIQIEVSQLGSKRGVVWSKTFDQALGGPLDISVPGLSAGGYAVQTRIGDSPPSRSYFACEKGGVAWADSRPDPDRLTQLSQFSGGTFVRHDELERLPAIESAKISAQRSSSPLAPPWIWTLASASLLGVHWLVRRSAGAL